MKLKVFFFTVMVFIALLSIVIGWTMGIILKENPKPYSNIDQTLPNTTEMEDFILLSYSFCDDVDVSSIVISDYADSLINYKDYVKGKPFIVFRYDMSDCDLCINSQRDVIIETMKDLNIKNILIMASFRNLREKHICINKEKEYFRHFVEYPKNIKNNPLEKMDECSMPYFFVTDETCHLRKLFFPIKSNPLFTKRYIYTICSYYNIE